MLLSALMATLVTRPSRPAIRTALANRFGTACLNVKVGKVGLQIRSNPESCSHVDFASLIHPCLCHRVFVCVQNEGLIEHYFGMIASVPVFRRLHTQSRYVLFPLTTAAQCPDLTIPHGNVSSTSKSKTMDTVQIICDDGYNLVNGTSATCSPVGPGKADWNAAPACEGRFD